MLPIPGTSSIEHLKENIAVAAVRLTDTKDSLRSQSWSHGDKDDMSVQAESAE